MNLWGANIHRHKNDVKAAEIWGTEMTAGARGVVLEFDSFWNKIVTVASPLCECTKSTKFYT